MPTPDQEPVAFDMHAGPGLDRLFPIHFLDGRLVSVSAFTVLPAYLGVLEGGTNRESNLQQRRRIAAIAEKRHGGPVVQLEPRITPMPGEREPRPGDPDRLVRERLPWLACIARLTSSPIVDDGDTTSSELTVVWWQDGFTLPLPQEIERAAEGLAWRDLAKDVAFW